jgi:phytanoyl-CoA hydroxylase
MADFEKDDSLLDQFDREGYIAIPGFLDPDVCLEWAEQVSRFIKEIVPGMPAEHVFYEDKADRSSLKQLQRMGDYDPWFQKEFTAGAFTLLAERLLGGPVEPKNMQYFSKPPGVGKPTPPHQDGYYFKLKPCKALTMWLALDDVDEANGCVRYVRGSHKRGLRKHTRTQTLGFSQGIEGYPESQDIEHEKPLSARNGDLLVHHALTIHRAEGNLSENRPRRAIGFIFYSEDAQEDLKAHASYQRRLAEELKSSGKI